MSFHDRARIVAALQKDSSLAHVGLSVVHLSPDGYSLERLSMRPAELLAARHANDTDGYEEQLRWEFRAALRQHSANQLRTLHDRLQGGVFKPLRGVEGEILMSVLKEMLSSIPSLR